MKKVLHKISGMVGLAALVILVLPSVLFLAGEMTLQQVKWIMLAATILWFVSAPFGTRKE